MAGERWLFSEEQIANTPSRKAGIDSEKETYYKQQAANFVQDMGQRLQVTQLCINTAIVYLHRFYMFHPFSKFHRNIMAEACLFLAAKVEEQPRKLEHVIKVAHMVLHRDQGPLDTKGVGYLEHAQELVVNENILLQSLGFELQVDHPHSHIVKTCNLIRAPKDLAQTSYFLATNSLHLTEMTLLYKPTFVACVCIHLACKWAQFEIPRSNQGKDWWTYVDEEMSQEILEDLTQNFLAILDKCPSKFKKKLMSKSAKDDELYGLIGGQALEILRNPDEKRQKPEPSATITSAASTSKTSKHQSGVKIELGDDSPPIKSESELMSPPACKPSTPVSHQPPQKVPSSAPPEGAMRRVKTESYLTSLTTKEYFERKERERKERERIERERQQLIEKEREKAHREKVHAAESGSSSTVVRAHDHQKEADRHKGQEVLLNDDMPHASSQQGRQHINIFDQMNSEREKCETVVDSTSTGQSKDKHSLERSHVQHSYKDKYHEKEEKKPKVPVKLPFSVDMSKLRDDQRKSGSHSGHRSHEHRPDPGRGAGTSGRHGYDPKHKAHRGQPEHRHPDRAHVPPGKDVHKFDSVRPPPVEQKVRPPVKEVHIPKPQPAPAPTQPTPQPPHPEKKLDPEEGEILDDDSPSITEQKEEQKRGHSREGERSHGHRHHHRERRSSGHRHHSPGTASQVVTHPEREPPAVPEGRTRHRSPRNAAVLKEEAPHHHSGTLSHKERNASVTHCEVDPVPQSKPPHLETILSKVSEALSVPERGTPEPGEIVEHRSRHGHHKSSHSKSRKKDKHRDHESLAPGDGSCGSLKIKLDLKGLSVGGKHSPATAPAGGEDRRKELKLKIKHPGLSDARDSQHTSEGSDDAPQKETLKMKLKVPSFAHSTGNGETGRPDAPSTAPITDGELNKSSSSSSIKLVLSKDSSSGQYMPTPPAGSSSSWHKLHRHSNPSEKGSSRKRPFSPSDGGPQREKLPRNESMTAKRALNEFSGELAAGSSDTSSPLVGGFVDTPGKESLMDTLRKMQEVIDLRQGQLQGQRTNKKHRHSNTPTTSDTPSESNRIPSLPHKS